MACAEARRLPGSYHSNNSSNNNKHEDHSINKILKQVEEEDKRAGLKLTVFAQRAVRG